MTPPPSVRLLGDQLRAIAKSNGQVEKRVRRVVAVAVLGQMLTNTSGGVIKGGTNLELRLGIDATRASSDLDAVRRGTLEEFRDQLEAALGQGWEGFTGRLVHRGEIAAPVPADYRPHRFDAKLDYNSKSFATVEVEVAAEEIGALGTLETVPLDATTREWFTVLGFPVPQPIAVLPLSHQIAQKLHACTAPDTGDWINDRAHDLVDLQLAVALPGLDQQAVAAAARRLFSSRGRHSWPPQITSRHGWHDRYSNEAEGLPVHPDLEEAVLWANQLVEDLDQF